MRVKPEGPANAKIMLIGEASGADEDLLGRPFVGSSGRELIKMLAEAGINRADCYLTNVFLDRPTDNKIESWMVKKADLPAGYDLPPITRGLYLTPSKLEEVSRLREEIRQVRPNVIVALGSTALWALTGQTGIRSLRGAVVESPYGKILPTFHPSYIMRAWSDRLILVADLQKALRHSVSSKFERPNRRLLINPTITEVENFYDSDLAHAPLTSVDIETKLGQITCVGLAASRDRGIVIPFVDLRQESGCYWSYLEELRAWAVVRNVVSGPGELLFQNGVYDSQYFLRYGISVRAFTEDTLVLHHSLYPELQKGLGFLGSLYLDEPAWKLMRKRHFNDTVKRDE